MNGMGATPKGYSRQPARSPELIDKMLSPVMVHDP